MARGRKGGGRRGASTKGRVSFPAIAEETFQDPSSDEEIDVTLEETGFIVSSPAIRATIKSVTEGMVDSVLSVPDLTEKGDEKEAPHVESSRVNSERVETARLNLKSVEAGIAQVNQAPKVDSSSSQEWGDKVEEEGGSVSVLPQGVNGAVQGEKQPTANPIEKQGEGQNKKKTWANVVGNRYPANGIQLEYVPPKEGVVEFTEEDIEAGVSAWNTDVIGQIMGESPSFKEILGFMHRAWSRIETPDSRISRV